MFFLKYQYNEIEIYRTLYIIISYLTLKLAKISNRFTSIYIAVFKD